jgi:putative two-component system response regulator
VRGSLEVADSSHIAACRALSSGRGFVLVYHPVAALDSQLAVLTQSLPSAVWVALFWTVAVLTIVGFVILGQIQEGAERQQTRATSDVLRQAQDLVRTRDAVIFGLAKLAESRDEDTGEHLERISSYATILAIALRRHSKYADEITPSFIRLIGIGAALHDIGKVGIEDQILLKRGPLSAAERAQMQTHTLIGAECLQGIEQRLGASNFLQMAREIVLSHHERWDGKGYPRGLAGDAIPLAARIVAIADTYDALSSKRVYKAELPHEECVAIIASEAGKHFDPYLIEVWLTLESKFRDVARNYEASTPASDEVGARDSAPVRPGERDDQASPASVPLPGGATEVCPELASLR